MKFVEIQNVSPKIPNQITCLCNGILAVDFCHTFEILIHYFVYKWTENSSKSHFHSNENGFYFSNSSSALYLHLNLKARFDWLSVRSCIWTHTSLWLRPIRKLYALNFSVAFVHFACSLLGYSNKKMPQGKHTKRHAHRLRPILQIFLRFFATYLSSCFLIGSV